MPFFSRCLIVVGCVVVCCGDVGMYAVVVFCEGVICVDVAGVYDVGDVGGMCAVVISMHAVYGVVKRMSIVGCGGADDCTWDVGVGVGVDDVRVYVVGSVAGCGDCGVDGIAVVSGVDDVVVCDAVVVVVADVCAIRCIVCVVSVVIVLLVSSVLTILVMLVLVRLSMLIVLLVLFILPCVCD